MQWQKGDNYFIHRREYKISRSWVRGKCKYSAWHRRELLGIFETLEAAKHIVEVHEAGLYPRGGVTYESAAV